jgi:hypothetical protein
MKRIKAVFLTLSLYTFLFWLYVAARVIFDRVQLFDPFIDSVPFLTFEIVGALTFVLSMVFMYLFLTTN